MTASEARPRILYAAPWAYLTTRSGVTRNVLSVARELSRYADVTVAFRRFLEPPPPGPFGTVAIESGPGADDESGGGRPAPSAADQLRYLRRLGRFVVTQSPHCDLVLEKSWRLSGYLVHRSGRLGIPGVVVENIVPTWIETHRGLQRLRKRALFAGQSRLVRRHLRQAPLVIAETEYLRRALVNHLGLRPDRIAVVGLGVDHRLFRPLPAAEARTRLGVADGETVLLYCGSLDRYHDIRPVIQALAQVRAPDLRLHVIGDGRARADCRALTGVEGSPVVFHGSVPHEQVPEFVAASDLCLAPYRQEAFPDGEVTFSTLKIPEFMACARPVASVPSGHIRDLIDDGVTGFLRPNRPEAWADLLANLPPRERLREMGEAAARAVAHLSWETTAAGYWQACLPLLEGRWR